MDFDFSRSFFEQFQELVLEVPRVAIHNMQSDNSEYTNYSGFNKNCYLLGNAGWNEDCFYSERIIKCQDSMDCFNIEECTRAYMSINSKNCYNINYCEYSNNLTDCSFCYDCRNCSNCFGSIGLRGKQYHFFNKPLTKDQYELEMKKIQMGNFSSIHKIFQESREHFLKFPRKYAWIFKSENITGDLVSNSKDSVRLFMAQECDEVSYTFGGFKSKQCMDCLPADTSELCYESMGCFGDYNVRFSNICWESSNLTYSDACINSSDLFGCAGIKKGKYMILNKQYTKEEYEALVPKIIEHMKATGEWGEFFPISMSPFGYNDAQVSSHYPLDEKTVRERGYKWNYNTQGTYKKETIKIEQMPDSISQTSNQIIKAILVCIDCQKNFKIIEKEFEFYQKQGVPVPRKCPVCRRKDRYKLRNPLKLWFRQCMCEIRTHDHPKHDAHLANCQSSFESPFNPSCAESVFCEECYQQVVY